MNVIATLTTTEEAILSWKEGTLQKIIASIPHTKWYVEKEHNIITIEWRV